MPRREDTAVLDAAFSEQTERQTLAETVTARIRELILDGALPAGLPLRPSQLAPRLGVSVMPIREALRILEAEGLVTFEPRIGARVSRLSEEDVEEIYLVRGALEGLAARLAAERMSAVDLRRLHEAFDEMTAAYRDRDLPRFMQWDREFHVRQLEACGRPQLVKKILDLWDSARRIYAMTPKTSSPMENALRNHEDILGACDDRDAGAAERLTRVHTEAAAARILAVLRTTDPARSSSSRRRPRRVPT